MGFFKRFGKKLKSDLAGGLDLLSSAFVRPVETTKGVYGAIVKKKPLKISKTIKEVKKQSIAKNVGATLRTTALGVLALSPAKAVTGAKTILLSGGTKAVVGKVGGALLGTGIYIGSKRARDTVSTVTNPGIIVEKGIKTGKYIDDPGKLIKDTKEKGFLDTVKDVGVKGGIIAGTGALLYAGTKVLTSGKDKIPEVVTPVIPPTVIPPVVPGVIEPTTPTDQLIPEKAVPTDEGLPVTPETTTVTTGAKKRRKYKTKKIPSIRQSVRVNVLNRPINTGVRIQNKRYINTKLLN